MDPPRAGVANGEEARQGPSTLLQKACESCPFFFYFYFMPRRSTQTWHAGRKLTAELAVVSLMRRLHTDYISTAW